jgi:hypothetical protein
MFLLPALSLPSKQGPNNQTTTATLLHFLINYMLKNNETCKEDAEHHYIQPLYKTI